jgi:hypothetical protein
VRSLLQVTKDEFDDVAEAKSMLDTAAENLGPDILIGIEGPNEPNNPKAGENWADHVREYQRWLYDNVKATSQLSLIPVIGPSIWGRLRAHYSLLGDMSSSMDAANLHYYTGGRKPTLAGAPVRADEGGGGSNYDLDEAISDARTLAPQKPLWITEFGYPVSGPGTPLSSNFMPPLSSAKYLLRGIAEFFRRGIPHTFIYSLVDDEHRKPPRYHGLLTADLKKRLAYQALRNFIALFSDPGPSFAGNRLEWSESGESVSRLPLMQKRDGRFYLTFWTDTDSYDRQTHVAVSVPPVRKTMEFASSLSSIRVFAPTIGETAILEARNARSLTLDVSDHLTVVELRP